MKSEAQILSEVIHNTRSLSKYYLSKLRGKDLSVEFEIGGKKLNSGLWLLAHMAWGQNFLLLNATGGTPFQLEWLDEYSFGSEPSKIKTKLSIEDILPVMKSIHEASLSHVSSLSSEKLDEPNNLGLDFSDGNSKRMIIHHHIRHEGCHIGQLGWLVKLYGEKAI